MRHVHLFVSSHRVASWEALRAHIDPRYTPDGDALDSPFMQETGLTRFEPGCIEAIWAESGEPEALAQLLADSSYSAHWLPAALALAKRQGVSHADALICAFDPNAARCATWAACALTRLARAWLIDGEEYAWRAVMFLAACHAYSAR